jgi:uncharacterized protein (TIGR02300 family)
MPKAEWGVKRTCPNCETRFYDLQREPILCPECGTTFNMDDHGKVSGMRERRVPVAVAEDDADPLVEDDEALVEDDETVEDPLLADDEDDEKPAGPTLADEDEDEQEAVPLRDDPLLADDDEIDEDLDEDEEEDEAADEDDLEDLENAPGKKKGG